MRQQELSFGIYDHYTRTKEDKFLKDNLKMLEKASKFLEKYVDDIIKEKQELRVSYDIWEMHEGVSCYSLSCIFAAFDAMIKIYEVLEEKDKEGNRLKQEGWLKQMDFLSEGKEKIKKYVIDNLYDEKKKSFVRNQQDKRIDISILGLVTPFNMLMPNDKKIQNTIERINMTLRTYTGGYLRFEEDHYTGERPWVISGLWMALYYIQIDEIKKAKECFDFAAYSSTKHGFLAEQVQNSDMTSAWVIRTCLVTCNVYNST